MNAREPAAASVAPPDAPPARRTPIRTVLTEVRAVTPVGADAWRIELADPDDWPLPPFRPGAHVDLHLPDGAVRTYSLCNPPAEQTCYVLGVKLDAESRGGSRYLCRALRPGDRLGVSLPRGGLPLAGVRRVVMVAGGIGVTPFLPVLATAGLDCTLHLVHRGAYPFADLLAPQVAAGRVVLHDTAAAPRPSLAALIGDPAPGVLAACCGPQSMIVGFEAATARWPVEQVHVERFTAPAVTRSPDARDYRLVLKQSGKTMDVPADMSVLSALRHLDVPVDAACEGGICGACKVRWLAGQPIHQDLVLDAAQRREFMLCCVASSAGPELVLDL